MSALQRLLYPAISAIALGYLAAMVLVGAAPVQQQLVRFEAKGVLRLLPEAVRRVEIDHAGTTTTLVRRGEKAWATGSGTVLDPSTSAQLDTAVNVLHRSGPVREIEAQDLAGVDTGPFGLDAPVLAVSVFGDSETPVLTARFGNLNPEGILQYMRLQDSERVYLMSRFVSTEWITALDEAARQ